MGSIMATEEIMFVDYRTLPDDAIFDQRYITFLNGWPVDHVAVANAAEGYIDLFVPLQQEFMPTVRRGELTTAHVPGPVLARVHGKVEIHRELVVMDNLDIINRINKKSAEMPARRLKLVK